MCFLFNRTTLQVFVTYLTVALYVHPLWLYKHQHDNRVHFKLYVSCQRWWIQWRFWFVPSVPGYVRYVTKIWCVVLLNKKTHILLSQMHCVWQVVKSPTIISNNPVHHTLLQQFVMLCLLVLVYSYALKTVTFKAVCYLGSTEHWQHTVWISMETEKFEVGRLKLRRLTAVKCVTKMPRLQCSVTRQVNC